jgi:hypothetical protein
MPGRPTPEPNRPPLPARQLTRRRWLLLVHHLPARPSNLRVRIWRRLQQLGAVAVKQAVFVLPDSPDAREDFEWLKTEIEGEGGQASVFAADSVDAWSDDALVEEFRRSRQRAYEVLARDVEQAIRRGRGRGARRGGRGPSTHQLLGRFRHRLTTIERIDFFGSAGRDRVVGLLDEVSQRLSGGRPRDSSQARAGDASAAVYRRRLWVTRPRPGVDRMASAWLIRRFIDPQARFGFVPDREAAPPDSVPFDMFGVEFGHRGERCTLETLCDCFGISEAAVVRVAGLVHDLDLKDGRFGAPEALAIGTVIDGLQLGCANDDVLLEQGMTLFEALYRAFEQSARRAGPRPVVRPRKRNLASRRQRR